MYQVRIYVDDDSGETRTAMVTAQNMQDANETSRRAMALLDRGRDPTRAGAPRLGWVSASIDIYTSDGSSQVSGWQNEEDSAWVPWRRS